MAKVCFACVIILLAYSCTGKLSTSGLKQGKIQSTAEYPGFTDTTFSLLAFKIDIIQHKWYKGNLVIDEKVKSYSHTENGKTTESLITTGYVFMNFKTKRAAEYAVFSDTAQPLQTFALYDTVKLADKNYHWGAKRDTTTLSRHVDMLPDTTIDKVLYKRAVRSYTQEVRNKPRHFVQIYYLRPDLSEDLGRIYFWRDSLTRSLKAPIVWVEERLSVDNPVVLSKASLAFVADTLTAQEKRVFAAWLKNEKNR